MGIEGNLPVQYAQRRHAKPSFQEFINQLLAHFPLISSDEGLKKIFTCYRGWTTTLG